MKFDVCGGFEICRKPNRHGKFDKDFWASVAQSNSTLPEACGCYIFALRNGDNIVTWYVGKTEKRTFQQECFQAAKINYYNEILVDHNGTPLLFLLPRLTAKGKKFSKRTKFRYRDVDYLETILIGMALEKNPHIYNVKKTKVTSRDGRARGHQWSAGPPYPVPTRPEESSRHLIAQFGA